MVLQRRIRVHSRDGGAFNYYTQFGHRDMPVFQGQRYQFGYGVDMRVFMRSQSAAGLGDKFLSAWRFMLPILSNVGKKFVTSTASSLNSDNSDWKNAIAGAIAPSVSEGVNQVMKKRKSTQQEGSGITKKRKRSQKRTSKTIISTIHTKQRGNGKKKRQGKNRKQKHKKTHKRSKAKRVYKRRQRNSNPSPTFNF